MRSRSTNSVNQTTVLIVDDEPVVRRLISRIMHQYFPSFHVEQASNGVEANDKLLTDHPPRLMILDLQMPYLGGLELCRLMQMQPRRYKTRVLVMTGCPNPGLNQEIFQKGASEFLLKPFQIEDLRGSIDRLL